MIRPQDAIVKITEALNALFDDFNQHYYGGELPADKKVITTQTTGKVKGGWMTTGHCDNKESWGNQDGTERLYEINVVTEILSDYEQVCETLLHEMAHFYASVNGIKDCYDNGAHGVKYRKIAEEHGLTVKKPEGTPGWRGWCLTKLTDEATSFIRSLPYKAVFEIAHDVNRGEDTKKPETSKNAPYIIHKCPMCEWTIRVTANNEAKGKCWRCGADM